MPGLLAPPGTVSGPGPQALERALSRANVQVLQEAAGEADEAQSESILRRCFGLERLPTGALTRAGELPYGVESIEPGVHWLRADPVHLRPDLAGMSMLPTEALDLQLDEARELVEVLNGQVADESFAFEAPSAGRWYLRSIAPFEIQTTPPGEALKQQLNRCLPRGSGAARWNGVMNEVQMALHGAGANARRAGRGRMSVNSVWLWGEGTLPPHTNCPFANVWSDDPLARGLARTSGGRAVPLPDHFDAAATREAAAGGLLVHAAGLEFGASRNDTQAWLDAVVRFTTETIEPLLALLGGGGIDRLSIEPGGARSFELSPNTMKRWWRPRRRWQRWLHSCADADAR